MNRAARRIMLLILTVVPAGFTVLVAVEAIRTGRFALDTGKVADSVPDDFYETEAFLPAGILDNGGWVIAACIIWIVVVALLAGVANLRRTGARRSN